MDGLLKIDMTNTVRTNIVVSNYSEGKSRKCGLDEIRCSVHIAVSLEQGVGDGGIAGSLRRIDVIRGRYEPESIEVDSPAVQRAWFGTRPSIGVWVGMDLSCAREQASEEETFHSRESRSTKR